MWSVLSKCIFLLIALSSPGFVPIWQDLLGDGGFRCILWTLIWNGEGRGLRHVSILSYGFFNKRNPVNVGVLFCICITCFFTFLKQNWNNKQALTSFFMEEKLYVDLIACYTHDVKCLIFLHLFYLLSRCCISS